MARPPIGKVAMTQTERTRRWRAKVRYEKLQAKLKDLKPRRSLRLNATHSREDRGDDAYFTHPVAVHALYCLERQYLPPRVLEPAAGDGAIVNVLRGYGHIVTAADIADYGLEGCLKLDYLSAVTAADIEAIVTNPPFARAEAFIRKALSEVPYVAMLLRSAFLESADRDSFFEEHPFTRMWQASLRLPMMHRRNWTGPRASSNIPFAWFIWDRAANEKMTVKRFNWKKLDFDWQKVVAGTPV